MRVVITTVAWGGWYRKGLERQIREFERVSPGYELQGWLNVLPPGTPNLVLDGVDYTGYAAKPWAMKYAMVKRAGVSSSDQWYCGAKKNGMTRKTSDPTTRLMPGLNM